MGEEIKNVQLRFSCSENWDSMSASDGGKYCDKCQKKVYDFTNSKAAEFQQILAENNYKVCGKFIREQMHAQPIVLPFWKKWVSAAMVLIGVNLTNCKSNNSQTLVGDTVMLSPTDSVIPSKVFTDNELIGKVKLNKKSCLDSTQKISTMSHSETADTLQYFTGGVEAEILPEFPGGYTAWKTYVNKNLNHNLGEVQGRVIISFIVEKDGSVTNAKVIRGIAKAIDSEAVRIVNLSPKWKPGMINAKPARKQYTVPIIFN